MSLQGSIHTWSDGIGYGAFIPNERAYYNVSTPRAHTRRPSSEQLREYRRNNVTGGIDTHRSDVSFGKTTESVRGGREGEPRAREATKSLTSGEVGGFVWPAERARDGDVETILASSSASASKDSMAASSLSVSGGRGSEYGVPSTMLSPHSVEQHEKAAEAQVVSARERQRRPLQQEQEQQKNQQQLRGEGLNILSARSRASTSSNHGGGFTHRSDSTCAPSTSWSTSSYTSSRLSSFRSAASSSSDHQNSGRRRSGSSSSSSSSSCSSRSRHRAQRPSSYDAPNQGAAPITAEQQLSHRSNHSRARERRLRPPTLRAYGTPPPPSSSAPSATRLPRVHALDPVFDRHHKYDLVAEERAAQGGEVTGRYGEVHGSSVLAASQLTSELSTPWSHVLRGQKW